VQHCRAATIALGLLCVPGTAAASDGAKAQACRPHISIAETVSRPGPIEALVRREVCRTLDEHEIALDDLPEGRALVVDVSGVGSRWVLSVGVEHDGELVFGSPEVEDCPCSDEQMLVAISRATAAVVPLLVEDAAGDEPQPTLPPLPTSAEVLPPPLETMGKVGVGLLSSGAAGAAIGIALVASGSRVNGRIQREGRDLRPAGYALLGTSLAVGITGAILLGLDRRRARRGQAKIVPSVAWDRVGLTVIGRF
jgi:hypothetical protein